MQPGRHRVAARQRSPRRANPKPNPNSNQGGDGAPSDRPTRASVDLSLRARCTAPDDRAHARAAAAHDSAVERGDGLWAMASGLGHTPHSSEGQGPAGDRGPGTARLAWAAEPAPRRGHMHAATAPATYGCSPRHLRLQASTTPRMRSRCGLSPYLSSGSYPGSPHMTRPCPCR